MRSSEFKMLVMPYSSKLYRMAFRLLNNAQESEDIVQEVYLKLWGMRHELKNYRSVEALSIRITRNLCLDLLRRRKVDQEALAFQKSVPAKELSTPEDDLVRKEKAALVRTLIASLPEPQRSLVHLRHMEGKEYEEISEMVNMNVNAIRVSLSRARKQLRDMLEKKQFSIWKT
jgi:RNA polymerase sigma factor (sigma-70 family)